MERKAVLEIAVLMILLSFLIIPGMLYSDIIAHELYHLFKHREYAKEICMDVNSPSDAHVTLIFPDKETKLHYSDEEIEQEEITANRIGKLASFLYLVNAIFVINWIFLIMLRKR